MTKMNQCSVLLNHMMRHGGVTAGYAREMLGIANPGARIAELRDMGLAVRLQDGLYRLPRKRIVRKPRVADEDDLFPDYEG